MMQFRLRVGEVDLERRQVRRGEETLVLSSIETDLLSWFIEHPGQIADRDTLLVEVWGFPKPVVTRAVDNTIMRLRRKIEVDPASPDHLLTLRGRGYSFEWVEAAAPSPAPVATHRLRATPVGFHGRQSELAALDEAVATSRWVSLLGPGGIGKTTLARTWARLRGGTQWCDLSACSEEGDVRRALATLLDTNPPSAQAIGDALAELDDLLILDNVEPVADAVVSLLLGWMPRAPRLRVLLTSRERLRVAQEQVIELLPLDAASARSLFLHRAEAAGASLPESALPLVDAIVAKVDHLPLAIELAAARTRVLPLPRLLDALSDVLVTLRSDRRDLPQRHRTLRASILQSYEQLDAHAQRTLKTVSLLVDGFDLDLLDGIVDLGPSGPWVVDALGALRDHSLLHAPDGFDGDARFRTLEVVRQFAAQELAADAEGERMEDTVVDWFVARSSAWRAGVSAARPQPSIQALSRERQNLVALTRRVAERRPKAAAQIVFNLGWHVLNRMPDAELLELGVVSADRAGDARLQVANRLLFGRMLEWTGRAPEAISIHERALALARDEDPAQVAIACFHVASHQARAMHTDAAIATCREGLAAAEAHDKKIVGAMVQQRLGAVLESAGRHVEAKPVFEAARDAYARLGQETALPYALLSLAHNAAALGDLSQAHRLTVESIDRAEACSLSRFVAVVRLELAWILLFEGNIDAAGLAVSACEETLQSMGDPALLGGARLVEACLGLSAGRQPDADVLRRVRADFEALSQPLWMWLCDLLSHVVDPDHPLPDGKHPEAVALRTWGERLSHPNAPPPTGQPPAWMSHVGRFVIAHSAPRFARSERPRPEGSTGAAPSE